MKLVHDYILIGDTHALGTKRKTFFSIMQVARLGFLRYMSEEQALEFMERTLHETLKGSPIIKVINDKQVVMRSEHIRVGDSLRSGYPIHY